MTRSRPPQNIDPEPAADAPISVGGSWRDDALAAALAATTVSVLIYLVSGAGWAQDVASLCLVLFIPLAFHLFKLREKLLLAAAVITGVALLWLHPEAWPTILIGLHRGAYFAAFMVTVGLLKDAAATSPSVLETGRFLTRQPPGLRYTALSAGAHFMAVLLNLGALSMLAPLIKSGVQAGRDAGEARWISDIKERRQVSAALRGFAVVITWTPTTVTQAALLAVAPAAELSRVIPYGLGFSAIALIFGWIEDRLRFRWAARRAAEERGGAPRPMADARRPTGAIARFLAVCFALAGASMALHFALGISIVGSLMIAAPIVMTVWIFLQYVGEGVRVAATKTSARCSDVFRRSVPASSPEAFTLAIAGFIGVVLGQLAPPSLVSALVGPDALPPIALLALLPALIILVNQIAVTPMISAVFLGSAVSALDPSPVDPNLLVLALSAGWALCLTAAPFAAGPLVLSRITGIRTTDLSWRWNGVYSLLIYAVLVAWLAFLHFFVISP